MTFAARWESIGMHRKLSEGMRCQARRVLRVVRLCWRALSLRQVENQQQCVFDAAEFVVGKVPDSFAECACVDGADHLA